VRDLQHPLIEPDVRFSRIRLSEHLRRRADAGAGYGTPGSRKRPSPPVQERVGEGPVPRRLDPVLAPEVDADPLTDEPPEAAERAAAVKKSGSSRPSRGPPDTWRARSPRIAIRERTCRMWPPW
jgi:hypothetical protein